MLYQTKQLLMFYILPTVVLEHAPSHIQTLVIAATNRSFDSCQSQPGTDRTFSLSRTQQAPSALFQPPSASDGDAVGLCSSVADSKDLLILVSKQEPAPPNRLGAEGR